MHRTYIPQSDFSKGTIIISNKEEVHHIKNVLRIKKGEGLSLFNDSLEEAEGIIESISPKVIIVDIAYVKQHTKKCPEFILACAMPKKSKFEMIIEKSTELGVDSIIPLKTQRTETDIKAEKEQKKLQRFRTVAINASKQSKRISIPTIHPAMNLESAINLVKDSATMLIPSLEDNTKNLLETLSENKKARKIVIFVGPEGDFTDEEYSLAKDLGCIAVTLGETTLKVETAAISALSCANIFYRS